MRERSFLQVWRADLDAGEGAADWIEEAYKALEKQHSRPEATIAVWEETAGRLALEVFGKEEIDR